MKPHYPTTTNSKITSNFGWRTHPINRTQSHHDGIDIAPIPAGKKNVPIYAVADGIVEQSLFNSISGNRIYIRHSHDNQYSVYGHLASRWVKKGQRVKRGQRIGTMGTTGNSTGIHLHFGVATGFPRWSSGSNKGNFINPKTYLNTKIGIKEDGYLGTETVRALQDYFGLVVDGELWGQFKGNQATKAFNQKAVKYGKGGSPVVRSLQKLIGTKQDGIWGKDTTLALQKYFGMVADGIISRPSPVIKELQRRLNRGKL